jgi:hypothetical protein
MKLFKLLLAVAGATVLLGALVSTASANRLRSSSTTLRANFPRVNFAGGFGSTECAVTLEGSLHSATIEKVAERLIGYITRAIIGGTHCIRGSATILTTSLPWHVRYESFGGTLPNITELNTTVTGAQFNVKEPVFGIACLASGGTSIGRYRREAGGILTSAIIGGESPTSCGRNGTLEGTSNSLTVLNSTTRITVTLI